PVDRHPLPLRRVRPATAVGPGVASLRRVSAAADGCRRDRRGPVGGGWYHCNTIAVGTAPGERGGPGDGRGRRVDGLPLSPAGYPGRLVETGPCIVDALVAVADGQHGSGGRLRPAFLFPHALVGHSVDAGLARDCQCVRLRPGGIAWVDA